MILKVGDVVRCINRKYLDPLTIGSKYVIVEVEDQALGLSYISYPWITILNDNGRYTFTSPNQFELVKDA